MPHPCTIHQTSAALYFIPNSKFNISRKKKKKVPHPISVPFQITTPCEQWTELKVTSFLLPIFHHCQVFPQVICLMNKAWNNFPCKAKLKVNNFLILKPLAHSENTLTCKFTK